MIHPTAFRPEPRPDPGQTVCEPGPACEPKPALPSRARPVPAHLLARLGERKPGPVLAFGDVRVDAHLAGGGLAIGQLHEIGAVGLDVEAAALPAAFAARLLARHPGRKPVFWIAACCDLYPPGLSGCGLDPGRLVLVRATDDAAVLAAMETVLRGGAACAVVAEAGRLDRTASRRLQLACLRHGTTALVLRRWPHGCKGEDGETSVAVTRWRLSPAPSAVVAREPGPARWRAELLHARGGREGAWIMEEGEDASHPVRVVARLADHPAAPRRAAAG